MAKAIRGIETIKNVMDKYSSSSAEFFSLRDDGETATVRFLHKDDNDLDIYIVHKVKLAGKDRYVYCLASEDEPCPLCKAGFRPTIRIILTLLDYRDNKVKIWDRGKTEISNILGLITRYGNLSERKFDIVRHGKMRDPKTTYQFFPHDADNEEVPKREPIIGPNAFILEKTAEELESMLDEVEPPGKVTQQQPQQQYGYQQQNNGTPLRKMF